MRALALAGAALGGVLLAAATAQTPAVTVSYRAASEDDASTGRVRVDLVAARSSRVVIWERQCAVAGRRDLEAPDVDADQFWTFRLDLTKDARGRPAARVRYRHVRESGPGPEQERAVALDGKDTLAIDAFSARTDCRYDRIQIAVSGG